MKECLLVFVGSGFGGVMRYLLSLVFIQQKMDRFPWSTLLANVIASFVIGLLFGLFQQRHLLSSQQYLLLATGFCGGLSTFSAFAMESNVMIGQQQYGAMLLYTILSLVICLTATFAGKFLVT